MEVQHSLIFLRLCLDNGVHYKVRCVSSASGGGQMVVWCEGRFDGFYDYLEYVF